MKKLMCPECTADRGQDASMPTGESGATYKCPTCRVRWSELADDAITLISFGHLHLAGGTLPEAERVEDVRARLCDPAAAKDVLDLDGFDPRVQQIVLNTPGAREWLDELTAFAEGLPADKPRRIATGCAGGRHRAPGLTELLANRLIARGHDVAVRHLHVHLPRVLKKDVSLA